MKASRIITPLMLAALAFGITLAWRKQSTATMGTAGAAEAAPQAPAKARHREEDAFAGVRKCLRAGDLEGARAILSALGERDPVAFFELLAKLPGFPGLDDLIRSAAEKLPWNQPQITKLLNGIGPHDWRDLAWGSYTAPRAGVLPDKEVLDVGGKADDHRHLNSIQKLLEDAALKRPESFMEILNEMGGTSLREEFVREVMKHHPELGGVLLKSIPDGSSGCNYDRAYILQVRSLGIPTADNLLATLGDIGERGIYSGDFAPLCASHVYRAGSVEEKARLLETIRGLPDVARNRMLAGPLLYDVKELSATDFTAMVGIYSSGYLQSQALESWVRDCPGLDPSDRGWVAALPTEKLRARASELLDEKVKSVTAPAKPEE